MERMPLYLIMDEIDFNKLNAKTQKIILKELRDLAFQSALFKREMAMENFRCNNNIKAPSRLHCVYATDEDGIRHWNQILNDGDIEVFRIETIEEPFKTSEIFIPDESGNYEEMYKNSYRYWNPKLKNIDEDRNEYLVKGKIKILEKVDEFKNKRI